MERALEESNIPKHFKKADGLRIAFKTAAFGGQDDEGKVGPIILVIEELDKRSKVGMTNCLFHNDGESRPFTQARHEFRQVLCGRGIQSAFREHRLGNRGIAPVRRQDHGDLGRGAVHGSSGQLCVEEASLFADEAWHAPQHTLKSCQRLSERDPVRADHEFPNRILM